MRTLSASLRLVVPPLSNQEADRFRTAGPEADDARRQLGRATIYMIGQREEIFFKDLRWDEKLGHLRFTLVLGDKRVRGCMDVIGLSERFGHPDRANLGLSVGDKYIHILDVDENDEKIFVWGASPDAVLYHVWRQDPDIALERDARDLASYRLLYIGMSDDGAYQRLINAPHHARLDILTNELQIRAEARVSDETFFFMFELDPLHIQTWGQDDEITDEQIARILSPDAGLPSAKLTSDVEKAFISMLKTPYNKRRYKNYPKVAGGISDIGFDSYAYAIAEDLTFDVVGQRVDGGFAPGLPNSNDADFILVKGDEVQLIDISEEVEVDYD
jgi:hypothetical protein